MEGLGDEGMGDGGVMGKRDGEMDGSIDGWMDGWMGGWMNGNILIDVVSSAQSTSTLK